jgi:hypothetical protein
VRNSGPAKTEAKALKTEAQAAKSEALVGSKQAVKEGAAETTKQFVKVGGEETLKTVEKTGLKEGAKVLGTKAAKFVPFVGIGVGIGLAANDWRKGDYESLAWDVAEAIPVIGDVVGAGHLGIVTGTALNEGLGIDKVAQEHGDLVESAATYLGADKDTARILGATGAAISSITYAPMIALDRKISYKINQWLQ